MRVRQLILDFFFPTHCLVCKTGKLEICEKCFEKILQNIVDKNNILSVYSYREKIVNKLLWKLKYHHTHFVADIFGKKLAQEFLNWFGQIDNNYTVVLIPIPLNKRDKRMYNHAELIANSISKNLNDLKINSKVFANLLIKNSQMKQAHSGRKNQRIKNIENTISINANIALPHLTYPYKGEEKEQKNIFIIVDDVTTTGATIVNARNILGNYLNIPEENILGITVAH